MKSPVAASLTIKLGAPDVPLAAFVDAMREMKHVVDALTARYSPGVTWVIDELRAGSAIATVRATARETTVLKLAHTVERRYLQLAKATQQSSLQKSDLPEEALFHARRLASLSKAAETSVWFVTAKGDEELGIVADVPEASAVDRRSAWGSLSGRVETLRRRGGLGFTLFDELDQVPVLCFVSENREQELKTIWGARVSVEGLIKRDPETGYAVTVREIEEIEVLKERSADATRGAFGSIKFHDDAPRSSVLIRRVRDGA